MSCNNNHRKIHHHHNNHNFSCRCCSNSNACSCISSCNTCQCSSSNPNPNPSPNLNSISSSDQLLEALTTHFLFQSQPQPQIFLQKPNKDHHNHHHHQQQQQPPKDENQFLIFSLLNRVSALELSLSKSPSPQPPQKSQLSPSPSLKHLAASTIQRHFRRLLARRSRTLRDLKLLASLKSQAAALRSSISPKTLNNPTAISEKAMDLLFQLDSIQSSDVMIREGKQMVGRELVWIAEFVDKVLMKEREDEVDGVGKRKERGKRVSFVENGDEGEVLDCLSEKTSDKEEATHLKNERFYNNFSNKNSGLDAPLPVKMESRREGSVKKVIIED